MYQFSPESGDQPREYMTHTHREKGAKGKERGGRGSSMEDLLASHGP